MVPRTGCLAGQMRHGTQLKILRKLGATITSDVKVATHLVLDERLVADEAVEALGDLHEWPAIHTTWWISRCSIQGALLATECLHKSHCEVPRHRRTQTTPSSALPSYSGSQDLPPSAPSAQRPADAGASGSKRARLPTTPGSRASSTGKAGCSPSASGASPRGGDRQSARELEPRRLALAAEAYPGAAVGNHYQIDSDDEPWDGNGGRQQRLADIPEEGDEARHSAALAVGRAAAEEDEDDPYADESDDDEDILAKGHDVAMSRNMTTKELIVEVVEGLAKVYRKGGAGGTSNSENWGRNQHWAQALGTIKSSVVEPVTAAQLRALKGKHGVGDKTIAKLLEIYKTGTLRRYEALASTDEQKALNQLTAIWGIAERGARDLMAKGVTTRAQLLERTELWKDLRPGSISYLKHADELKEVIPRTEIAALEERVRDLAREVLQPPPLRVIACGSYRRGSTCSTDVDIIVIVRNEADARRGMARLTDKSAGVYVDSADEDSQEMPTISGSYKLDQLITLLARMRDEGILTHDLSNPKDGSGKSGEFAGNFYMGICRCVPGGAHRRIDMRTFEEHEEAAALLHCTGSGIFNRCLQRVALEKGMQLSEKGLCRANKIHGDTVVKAGSYRSIVEVQSEQDIFEALGIIYQEPWQREDKQDVLAVETGCCWFQKKQPPKERADLQLEGPQARRLQDQGSRPLPLPAPSGVA